MNIFKIDLKRAILSKNMLFSILIGVLIIFLGMYIEPLKSALDLYYSNAYDLTLESKMRLIKNSLNKVTLWNFGNYFYDFVMPIICCIPFTSIYFKDKQTGFNKCQIIRTSYKKYILSKFTTTFISGFLSIGITSIIFLSIIIIVDSGNNFRSIYFPDTFLSTLSRENFNLFVLIHIIICSFMGGVYAVIGLSVSVLVDNILVALICPFLMYYIGTYILSIVGAIKFAPLIVIKFYNFQGVKFYHIFPQLIILFMLSALIFFIRTYRSDTYE